MNVFAETIVGVSVLIPPALALTVGFGGFGWKSPAGSSSGLGGTRVKVI